MKIKNKINTSHRDCFRCKLNISEPFPAISPFCAHVFHYSCLNFGLLSTKKTISTCNDRHCFSNHWMVPQEQMNFHEEKLNKLENNLHELLEKFGPLKPQMKHSKTSVDRMIELVNLVDLIEYNLLKQQIQQHDSEKNSECSKNTKTKLEANTQNSLEQQNNLDNTQNTKDGLKENQSQHLSDINNLQLEYKSKNQQSSENLENLNEYENQLHASEEQKHFEQFMNTVEIIQKRLTQLILKVSTYEHNSIQNHLKSLNNKMTSVPVNSTNSSSQQQQRWNQTVNTGETLIEKIDQLEYRIETMIPLDGIESTVESLKKQTAVTYDSTNPSEHQHQRCNQMVNIGDNLMEKINQLEYRIENMNSLDAIENILKNLNKQETNAVTVNSTNPSEQQQQHLDLIVNIGENLELSNNGEKNKRCDRSEITSESFDKLITLVEANSKNSSEQQNLLDQLVRTVESMNISMNNSMMQIEQIKMSQVELFEVCKNAFL